ncbi:MAG TPA: metalloregulator ArsR/SmtB family transcription factor [Syntrophomonadaceae bacterium]|nr:metalloregulator ArsR/SmtB family transcription factor [Syntrophomonadaceae bacterium]
MKGIIDRIASQLKALGEPTRLKIVKFLSLQEMCVCELEAVLDMSQPRISQHLKVLKQAGILKERKDKQRSFFSLSPVFQTGQIPSFTDFVTGEVVSCAELAQEYLRFQQLDSNEEVQVCKTGGQMQPIKLA